MTAPVTHRPPLFEVVRAPLAGAPGVRLRGELDLSTAPDLSATLDAAIRESEGVFVVDLCDLDFLDSTGVSAFVRARAVLGRDDRPIVIVCPPGPARRIFDVAGIADLFTFFAGREEAAASLKPPG